MNNTEFVPLDLGLMMKERGYKGVTNAYRVISNNDLYISDKYEEWYAYFGNDPDEVNNIVLTPTYAQAFKWLLTTHNIYVSFAPRSWNHVDGVHIIKWSFWADILDIWMCNLHIDERSSDDPYDTIEAAEYAALKGAILLVDRLPEIKEKLSTFRNYTKNK